MGLYTSPDRKHKGSETEFLLQDPLQFLEDIFGKGRVVFTLAADSAPIHMCMEKLHSPKVSTAPSSAESQPRWELVGPRPLLGKGMLD